MPAWRGGCRICHRRRQQRESEKESRLLQLIGDVLKRKLKEWNSYFMSKHYFLVVNSRQLTQLIDPSPINSVDTRPTSLAVEVHRAQTQSLLVRCYTSLQRSSSKRDLCLCECVWVTLHTCDFMCGWMHMCSYEKRKVPVILVCGSPQLTHCPERRGGKRVWRRWARRRQTRMSRTWEEEAEEEEEACVIKGYGNMCVSLSERSRRLHSRFLSETYNTALSISQMNFYSYEFRSILFNNTVNTNV